MYVVSRKDQSYEHKDIYQKIILLFWVYWSMSDYDEGTKESWGWSTRLRESLSPLLGFKGEKNGHSSSEAESSVNVKICFINNIIKENFPKSTSWKILTQCKLEIYPKEVHAQCWPKSSFFVSDLRSRIQAL